MDRALLLALNAERAARRPCVLVTEIVAGRQRLVRAAEMEADPLAEAINRAVRAGRSGLLETADGEVFLNVQVPPARLLVIGAVHISQALAPMAGLAGFDVEICDPRTAFATPERFPAVALHAEWPQDLLARRPLDPYTALAALTHDPKIDDVPLKAALEAGCFYVGALGSRKTHAGRLARLRDAGLAPGLAERIDAPIGLDIGASSPAEIAVAVLGSVIAALRRRPAETADGKAA